MNWQVNVHAFVKTALGKLSFNFSMRFAIPGGRCFSFSLSWGRGKRRNLRQVGGRFLLKIQGGGGTNPRESWGMGVGVRGLAGSGGVNIHRVHAKGVVLCERTCFCLLSTF